MCKPIPKGDAVNKQPEVTEATRAALVEAFCGFYRERPVERITVKEVAAKAGYSRATYYKYFPDNYELLEHVEDALADEVVARVGQVAPANAEPSMFVEAFAQVVESNHTYVSVLAGPMGAAHFATRLKNCAVPLLMAALGVPENDMRARMALEFYVTGLVSVLGSWLAGKWDARPEELGDLVGGLLREGVLTQIR